VSLSLAAFVRLWGCFMGYTDGMIQIKQLTEASDQAVIDLNGLLPQLSNDVRPLTMDILKQVVAPPDRLIVAVDDGRIVGTVLLLVNNQLVRVKAWLEDLVVSGDYRGQGLGGRLIEAAIAAAREAGAASIDITSKAERSALYKVYEQHGFKRRDSALFRLPLKD
jgi:GNAT superfamily N-acetyltransferase